MKPNTSNNDYKIWLTDIKSKIRTSQIKVALAVNAELIYFYWELGKMISEKENIWGNKLIETLSKDLKTEFPEMGGFSTRNLKYCKNFYKFYNNLIMQQHFAQIQNSENQKNKILQQLVAQIPWEHNILIFTKSTEGANFYINKTIQNQWSRNLVR